MIKYKIIVLKKKSKIMQKPQKRTRKLLRKMFDKQKKTKKWGKGYRKIFYSDMYIIYVYLCISGEKC